MLPTTPCRILKPVFSSSCSIFLILFVGLAAPRVLIADKQTSQPATARKPQKIVFLGDSLTAGYGLREEQAYPALIGSKLHSEGYQHVKVINAGVSGSTTASGLSRLKWQLKGNPTHLVLALGANDGLRGFELSTTEKNLRSIIKSAQNRNIQVLLAGMKVPPNYGEAYGRQFNDMFTRLSGMKNLSHYPFLLEKVAGQKHLNLADGIHPNPEGHKVIAEGLYPVVKKFLELADARAKP